MTHPAGLFTVSSLHNFGETARRFRAAVQHVGLTVFAEIDHAQNATEVGMALRPTLVLMFGDPRQGTPLMQASQTAGIDLPLKVLVWEGEDGATRLSYNDPQWVADRHGLGSGAAITAMSQGLAKLATAATA